MISLVRRIAGDHLRLRPQLCPQPMALALPALLSGARPLRKPARLLRPRCAQCEASRAAWSGGLLWLRPAHPNRSTRSVSVRVPLLGAPRYSERRWISKFNWPRPLAWARAPSIRVIDNGTWGGFRRTRTPVSLATWRDSDVVCWP